MMKRIVLLLASAALAVLLVSGVAWAATITFAPAKNFPAGDSPRAVAAADLDKDGDTDIMTVHSAIDRVSVLKRRADGTFAAPVRYATADAPTDIVGREDFDGDGDIDIATSNHSDSISVLLNKGNGTFAAQRKYATPALSYPVAIESGRLDGDRDWDLVTTNEGSTSGSGGWREGGVSVFKNNGNGTFAAASDYRAEGVYPGSHNGLDRADLDGDGDEDLAMAIGMGRELQPGALVMLGRGDGYFGGTSGETRYYLSNYESDGYIDHYNDIDHATDILINDLDGDGNRDLATTGSSNVYDPGNLHVFLGNGDGTFQNPQRLGTDESNVAMTEADFDRDGDIDIATIPGQNGISDPVIVSKVSILANDGNGTFGSESTIYPTYSAGKASTGIIRARMNNDTKPDLVVANYASDNVSVLINTTQ
jgi:FG-GAP-like repeat